MRRIRKLLRKLWSDENAVSSAEYALFLAFVAAGIIFAAQDMSNVVENEVSDCVSFDDAASEECEKL